MVHQGCSYWIFYTMSLQLHREWLERSSPGVTGNGRGSSLSSSQHNFNYKISYLTHHKNANFIPHYYFHKANNILPFSILFSVNHVIRCMEPSFTIRTLNYQLTISIWFITYRTLCRRHTRPTHAVILLPSRIGPWVSGTTILTYSTPKK